MSAIATAIVGSAVVGGVLSSNAASSAADAQSQSAADQIAESRRQFDQIQEMLKPYTEVGPEALAKQKDILGLNGPGAQFAAYDAIGSSPQMAALQTAGEGAILQNASATGGLRGGNTQAALAQFRPQLLNQLIDQQYQRLGGLTTVGQNSAAGVGTAGQNATSAINNAYAQQGAAQAGNALAQGQAGAGIVNGLTQAAGMAFGSPSAPSTGFYQPGTAGVSNTGGFTATPLFGGTSGYGGLGSGFY